MSIKHNLAQPDNRIQKQKINAGIGLVVNDGERGNGIAREYYGSPSH
jgi:hypothetical protein